uniref:Uncharacterized protein n=1 Tax=Zea mays TaxID=4577 RepID=C4J7K4_MAIZE|nr:unknown [Zea mays]
MPSVLHWLAYIKSATRTRGAIATKTTGTSLA